jgi:protein-disulfide isomerase-like protein with CxxC motif
MMKLSKEQKDIEIIEQAEIEEGSPLTKKKRQHDIEKRRKLSKLQIRHQPTFNFEQDD